MTSVPSGAADEGRVRSVGRTRGPIREKVPRPSGAKKRKPKLSIVGVFVFAFVVFFVVVVGQNDESPEK